jgi:hypothetical protein
VKPRILLVAAIVLLTISAYLVWAHSSSRQSDSAIGGPPETASSVVVARGSAVANCPHPLVTVSVGDSWRYRVTGVEGSIPMETTITVSRMTSSGDDVDVDFRVESSNGTFVASGRCSDGWMTDPAMLALGLPFEVVDGRYSVRDLDTESSWEESASVHLFSGSARVQRRIRASRAESEILRGEERAVFDVLVEEDIGQVHRFIRERWARDMGLVRAEFGPSATDPPYTVLELVE